MIKFIRFFLPFLGVALLLSCLGDDNNNTTTGTAPLIRNIAMGNLRRVVTTKTKTGRDSSYTVSFAGAAFPLNIDQESNRIFTLDSLPFGTRIEKVVFSTLTADGVVAINRLSAEGDTIFRVADSTNFSKPRTLRVYGTDGRSVRAYTVTILVHQEHQDSTTWNSVVVPELASMNVKHVFATGDSLRVFAVNGATPTLLSAAKSTPSLWESTVLSPNNIDLASVQQMGNTFYALVGGQLMSSMDGKVWRTLTPNLIPEKLLMAGAERLIGWANDTLYGSSDGVMWTKEPVVEGSEQLPVSDFSGSVQAVSTDTSLKDYLLVGIAGNQAVVWKRTIDTKSNETYPWVNFPAPSRYALPKLSEMSIAPYGEGSLLVGMNGGVPSSLYWSRDNGRTWQTGLVATPATLSGTSVAVATDSDSFIWIVAGGSGQIWRGRKHSVSWQQPRTSWTNAPRLMHP